MSRAFVKEDVDPPERSGRSRAPSGLPPGAVNYATALGANLLQEKLLRLSREKAPNEFALAELERVLKSITIVEVPNEPEDQIAFGARVTLRNSLGEEYGYRIVGVDELDLFPEAVSWISPTGRALLAADNRGRVTLPNGDTVTVVRVEYPAS
ncbi:MAG TPA: GreA/GreB family elongation factor [Chthoniobacterales bacterium]|jgi:transcription elongation GreA/GreB family factor